MKVINTLIKRAWWISYWYGGRCPPVFFFFPHIFRLLSKAQCLFLFFPAKTHWLLWYRISAKVMCIKHLILQINLLSVKCECKIFNHYLLMHWKRDGPFGMCGFICLWARKNNKFHSLSSVVLSLSTIGPEENRTLKYEIILYHYIKMFLTFRYVNYGL